MSEPTTWLVAVTGDGSAEHSEYRSGKDAHRVASERSRAPGAGQVTVTFNGCVTTYRDGIGAGPAQVPA